jgi:hypothetical protein
VSTRSRPSWAWHRRRIWRRSTDAPSPLPSALSVQVLGIGCSDAQHLSHKTVLDKAREQSLGPARILPPQQGGCKAKVEHTSAARDRSARHSESPFLIMTLDRPAAYGSIRSLRFSRRACCCSTELLAHDSAVRLDLKSGKNCSRDSRPKPPLCAARRNRDKSNQSDLANDSTIWPMIRAQLRIEFGIIMIDLDLLMSCW